MKEAKDSEIKLFGMNIAFAAKKSAVEGGGNDEKSSGFDLDFHLREEKVSEVGEEVVNEQENNKDCSAVEENQSSIAEESKTHDVLSESDDNSETTPVNEDSTALDPSKNEKDQSDTTSSEQKTLKKPDEILPCPRCNSMDTKFCYHNNYNVNQPRHFCKRCQRYWTAGGTMRNVPVGAGRRKSKSSASQGYHITVSESLQASQIDALNGYHLREFKPNGTLLSFGIDSQRCESLREKNAPYGTRHGCYNQEQVISIPCKGGENGDDCSSGSSVTTSNSMGNGGQNQPQIPAIQNINSFQSPIPCLPGVPWPYMWNPSVPMPAAVSPSGFPMPFYPVPYWNYNVPSPWSMPWLSPTSLTDQKSSGSDTNSPILGKHSRDGELLKPSTPEGKESSDRSILVPKTLRIDDPEEAAKSSIWATLGIKYDSDNKRRTMFNAFEPKYVEKKYVAATSPVLQANPAALSRSLSFQEVA